MEAFPAFIILATQPDIPDEVATAPGAPTRYTSVHTGPEAQRRADYEVIQTLVSVLQQHIAMVASGGTLSVHLYRGRPARLQSDDEAKVWTSGGIVVANPDEAENAPGRNEWTYTVVQGVVTPKAPG